MRISDLIKPLDQMSDAELLESIRAMRHRRETLKPVAKAKAARAEKKVVLSKAKQLDRVVDTMSPEELLKLAALLGASQ